jgi:hypothetical protein
MNHRTVISVTAIALAALALGCSKDDPTSVPTDQLFTVSPLFAGVDPGGTQQLSATVGANPVDVTWDSSNPAVATVSATGLVTGLTTGFTAITAKRTSDGSLFSSNINVLPLLASTPLTNGVPLTGLARATGSQGSVTLYRITVPAGKTKLTVSTTGPNSQDVDIFVRKSVAPVVPVTTAAFTADCKSDGPNTTESCSITNPIAGTYYIAVQLWTPYSDVTLTATFIP